MPYKDPEAKRANRRKLYAENREQRHIYFRKWRDEHRVEMRAYYAAYRATDAGYARMRADSNRTNTKYRGAVLDPDLTNSVLRQIFLDGEDCAWCGNLTPPRERRIDHRIAIVFGGEHTASNIQILCLSCDKQKTRAENSLVNKLRKGATRADFALAA